MILVETTAAMRQLACDWRTAGQRLGLVPTMGYLHAGHLSLVREARRQAERVVVSIFVNPTQFGPREDFSVYPRDLAGDLRQCEQAGVDAVFAPATGDMYHPDHSTWVDELSLSSGLCGASRPGHFRGVATVVAKLFNIVQPEVAVFGRKDAQQAMVIQRLVRDLNFPVQVVVAEIVREADGLAMSSRNARLAPEDRHRAVCLAEGLAAAQAHFAAGQRDAQALKSAVAERLRAAGAEIDYVELVETGNLTPVERVEGPALLAVAARLGGVRLIDNCQLGE